jgi:hypothetical protein
MDPHRYDHNSTLFIKWTPGIISLRRYPVLLTARVLVWWLLLWLLQRDPINMPKILCFLHKSNALYTFIMTTRCAASELCDFYDCFCYCCRVFERVSGQSRPEGHLLCLGATSSGRLHAGQYIDSLSIAVQWENRQLRTNSLSVAIWISDCRYWKRSASEKDITFRCITGVILKLKLKLSCDQRSVGLPSGTYDQIFLSCLDTGFLMFSTISDERMGLNLLVHIYNRLW